MTTATLFSHTRADALRVMADRLRRRSLEMARAAGSGHPTSCLSCAEIVAVLFFEFLRYDVRHPRRPGNDRFVLSKGHASPILWAAWAEAGAFDARQLERYRKFDGDLEGHPTPRSAWVDVATGSLGQGLANGAGMAVASKMEGIGNRVFVLMGDGELAEGSVWEAAAEAAHLGLGNLVAIVDVNRLGQSGPTRYGHDLERYAAQFRAFGWHVEIVDGHDVEALGAGLAAAIETRDAPAVVLARTIKGRGAPTVEDRDGYHGKPLEGDDFERALRAIGGEHKPGERLSPLPLGPAEAAAVPREPRDAAVSRIDLPDYAPDAVVATRVAFGHALRKLGAVHPRVVVFDGDVKNSTHTDEFAEAWPDRFIEGYIAEQNLVGMAVGASAIGWTPFVATFAAFLTRAHDFIRMAAISRANLKLCGSHCGISIGEDGPSQMGLEDLAMMRAVHGTTVLYPSDAVSAERMVALAAQTPGIVYVRTTRPATPLLYPNEEAGFRVGGSMALRSSDSDEATIVAAGITVHEALKAHEALARRSLRTRVLDCYSVKPIDEQALRHAMRDTRRIVVVEDHHPEGGLGEAVMAALIGTDCSFRHLAVRDMPRSGSADELMAACGIDARSIALAVEDAIRY